MPNNLYYDDFCRKYEEINPLDVNKFCHLTEDAYTKEQLISMEGLILKSIDFKCSTPTALFFAKHFLKLAGSPGSKCRF
jgi:hypothetical protein